MPAEIRFMAIERPIQRVAARIGAAAALALLLAGCESLSALNPFDSTEKYKPEIVNTEPPETIYNQGLARLNNNNYEGAAKKFEEVDKAHPFSPWSQKALLMSTFAHYEGGSYDDAISSARRYLNLHPASKDAAYAQYLLAMSYFRQMPDVYRDQEQTERALRAMSELIERYPQSEYVEDARQKIKVTQDQLAGRDMTVGRYYLEKRNYTGAINRFREVVARYQTTRHVEEALMRLTECYFSMGIVNEAQTAAAVLGHNFPDSPWYKDAFALLQSNGLAPREDTGSWISRAFRGLKTSLVGTD